MKAKCPHCGHIQDMKPPPPIATGVATCSRCEKLSARRSPPLEDEWQWVLDVYSDVDFAAMEKEKWELITALDDDGRDQSEFPLIFALVEATLAQKKGQDHDDQP